MRVLKEISMISSSCLLQKIGFCDYMAHFHGFYSSYWQERGGIIRVQQRRFLQCRSEGCPLRNMACMRVGWVVHILGKFRRRCGLADHTSYDIGLIL